MTFDFSNTWIFKVSENVTELIVAKLLEKVTPPTTLNDDSSVVESPTLTVSLMVAVSPTLKWLSKIVFPDIFIVSENIFWLIRSDPAKGLVLILFNSPYSSVFSL